MTEPNNSEEKFFNPFKGPDSYTEQDKFNFYGRDSEKNELIKLLDQNTLTLLYSRSGIGKSSLLNAGLIPILKKSKFYFPVYVRLTDKLITKETPSFSRAIIKLIIDAASNKEKKVTIKLTRPLTEKHTLTEFLYSSQFIQFNEKENADENIVPVIIFDQFEEIFSLKFDSDINDLIDDLSYVIEGKIPGVDNKVAEAAAFGLDCSKYDEDELNSLKNKLQQNIKWYRFIFSFRDEYLPHFESLMDKIPSIFKMSGRLNLQTFSVELASSVINKISKSSIEIDKPLCNHLAKIISTSDKQFETGFFILKKEVQPFMLSLVCKDLYPKIVGDNKDQDLIIAIEKEDSSRIDDIISRYTEDIFTKVSRGTRRFVEENLITSDDKRKLLALSDVKDPLVLSEMTELSNRQELRFLNIVDYSNTTNFEILHDRLLKPLLVSREIRRKEEDQKILEEKKEMLDEADMKRKRRILVTTAIVFAAGILILFTLMNSYNPFLSKTNTVNLQKLSGDIKKNSIGALYNIMEYQKSVNSIGEIGKIYFLPDFADPLMGAKKNLNDSIVDHFTNIPFFISFPDTTNPGNYIGSGISSKYNYIFYSFSESEEQNGAIDNAAIGGNNDTSTVKKDSTNSKRESIRIDFYKLKNSLIPEYISLPSISVLPSESGSKYNKAQFSPNEKYFFTPSGDSKLFYKMEDFAIGNLLPNSLPAYNSDVKFYKFLEGGELLSFFEGNDILISKITSPNKSDRIKNPDGTILYSAYIVNDKIIYCWRDRNYYTLDSWSKIMNYFSDGVSDTTKVNIKGGRESPDFVSNSIITLFRDTLRILNLQNFKLDSFSTEMKDPDALNIVENRNQFAVSNYFGDVHIYNTENYFKPEYRFKFENTDSNLFYKASVFGSPPGFGNKMLVYYQNMARIYDLDKKENDTTYKHFDFKYLKMELGYVYFNKDTSVTLIDRDRNIIKWYYEKESPENLEQLQSYIDYFLSLYGDKNFIFKQEFLETDSVEIKLMNAG